MKHDSNESLAHFGVLGMKWGVRRGRSGVGLLARKKAQYERAGERKKAYKEKKKSRKRKESLKDIPDAELRQKINRLQMEKQYKDLTKKELDPGRKAAQKIIKTGTSAAAITTTGLTLYNNVEKIKEILGKG